MFWSTIFRILPFFIYPIYCLHTFTPALSLFETQTRGHTAGTPPRCMLYCSSRKRFSSLFFHRLLLKHKKLSNLPKIYLSYHITFYCCPRTLGYHTAALQTSASVLTLAALSVLTNCRTLVSEARSRSITVYAEESIPLCLAAASALAKDRTAMITCQSPVAARLLAASSPMPVFAPRFAHVVSFR